MAASSPADYLGVIKSVYRRLIDNKEKHKRLLRIKPLSSGAASSVFSINSNIVGKVSKMEEGVPFADNKVAIWDYLHRKFSNDSNKDVLEKLVSLPLHKGIEKYKEKDYLVSLEPLIRGKTFSRCLLDNDAMSKDFKSTDENFFKVFYILFDLLLYLGEECHFNHNDLHFDNVMIVKAKDLDLCTYKSMYLKGIVTLYKVKYVPVIIDFDWATITSLRVIAGNMKAYYTNRFLECNAPPNTATHFCKIHTNYGYKAQEFYDNWSKQIDTAMFLGMFEYTNKTNSTLYQYIDMVKTGGILTINKTELKALTTNITPGQPYNIYNAFYLLHALDMFTPKP
jgi:hypothetical protein